MFQAPSFSFGFVILGEDVDGAAIETLASLGKAQCPGRPLEERRAEARFQILYPARDSRLAKFKVGSRAGKTAGIGNPDKQLHGFNSVQAGPPQTDLPRSRGRVGSSRLLALRAKPKRE
jgi:hypothetical protein